MTFRIPAVLAAIAALGLGGCSSIIEGTTQEVLINSNPAGANCDLRREGRSVVRANPTPGAATVRKTKHDITIECALAGYQKATFHNKSDAAAATFGNIVLGGVVGVGHRLGLGRGQ